MQGSSGSEAQPEGLSAAVAAACSLQPWLLGQLRSREQLNCVDVQGSQCGWGAWAWSFCTVLLPLQPVMQHACLETIGILGFVQSFG